MRIPSSATAAILLCFLVAFAARDLARSAWRRSAVAKDPLPIPDCDHKQDNELAVRKSPRSMFLPCSAGASSPTIDQDLFDTLSAGLGSLFRNYPLLTDKIAGDAIYFRIHVVRALAATKASANGVIPDLIRNKGNTRRPRPRNRRCCDRNDHQRLSAARSDRDNAGGTRVAGCEVEKHRDVDAGQGDDRGGRHRCAHHRCHETRRQPWATQLADTAFSFAYTGGTLDADRVKVQESR